MLMQSVSGACMYLQDSTWIISRNVRFLMKPNQSLILITDRSLTYQIDYNLFTDFVFVTEDDQLLRYVHIFCCCKNETRMMQHNGPVLHTRRSDIPVKPHGS